MKHRVPFIVTELGAAGWPVRLRLPVDWNYAVAAPGSRTVNTEPLPGSGRHRHVATHHARELARDGKAEPGAAETLRGRRLCLTELRK